MKKALSVLIAAAMLLTLCACGAPKAENTVKAFCEAMKAYDFEKMQDCLVPSAASIAAEVGKQQGDDEAMAPYFAKMKDWAAKMTYEIVSVKEEGDHATAEVKYYFVDSSPIMKEIAKEYLAQAVASVFSGKSDEELEATAGKIVAEKLETVEPGSEEMTITYDLVKSDKKWKITNCPDGVIDVLTADFLKSFKDIAAVFGGTG